MTVKKRVPAGGVKLSVEQKRTVWLEAMLSNGGNATQAAITAGYKPGAAAKKAGYRLSSDVHLKTILAKRRAEVLEKAREKSQLTADELLASLARDLRFDPSKLYDENGDPLPIHAIDEDTRLALRGLEVTKQVDGKGKVTGYTVKARYPEKNTARDQGMKHFGLYEQDNKQRPRGADLRVRFVPSPQTPKPAAK